MSNKKIHPLSSLAEFETLAASNACASDPDSRGDGLKVLVCTGGGCLASGSLKVKEAFEASLNKAELRGKIPIIGTGCLGPCVKGPVVLIAPEMTFYEKVKTDDVEEIVQSHLIDGKPVMRLTWQDGQDGKKRPAQRDIEFFKRQTKIVLRNCGLIDPENILEYIGREGYSALAKVLREMDPEAVIEEMRQSGLRGRGGAGFPTWMKWSFTHKAPGEIKYILCNADEGDPGAFMDRSILEGDPHSLIEGMAIGAYAVGATQGYVYVRAEYPLAVERLQKAIDLARALILTWKFEWDPELLSVVRKQR
jgi:(2Fe-2S) ferredoxin